MMLDDLIGRLDGENDGVGFGDELANERFCLRFNVVRLVSNRNLSEN